MSSRRKSPERHRALISYLPPDEGQPLRAKGPQEAFAAVGTFLERCTDCPAIESGTLVVSEPTFLTPPGYESGPVIERAAALFGEGERRPAGRAGRAVGAPSPMMNWRVEGAALARAVAFLSTLPAWPPAYMPPVHLSALSTFRLRDPASGALLPYQGSPWVVDGTYDESWVALVLTGAPTARFELHFPFETPGEDFQAYLNAIRPHLPLRLAWSRFRLLTPNAEGTGYVRRRIDVRPGKPT